MSYRVCKVTVLVLGMLLICGSAMADQFYNSLGQCLNYSEYMHVTASVPANAHYLDRQGDLVYVSSHQVIDVAVPGDPAIVGSYTGEKGDVRGIRAVGANLYILYSSSDVTGFNGLAAYSLADPLAPVLTAKVAMPPFMTQMRIIGDRAYLRNDTGLMLIVDISDENALVAMGSIGLNWVDSFDLNGNFLYAVDRVRNDIAVVDVSDPLNLSVDYRLPLNDVISISFAGGYGYFLFADNGTKVLEFTAPDQYTTLMDLPDLTRPLVIRDGVGYCYGKPLQVHDLTDPVNPSLMLSVPFVVHSGLLEPGRGLMLGISNAFAEMDLGVIAGLPGVEATVEVDATLTAMMASGTDLVTLHRMGLETFDASECTAPVPVGSLQWDGNVRGHALAGDYLYTMVQGSFFGRSILRVYDLADMSAPVEMAAKTLNGEFQGLVAVGDYLYTSEFGDLIVINVTDPLFPVMFTRTPGVGFTGIAAVDGANMVVADGTMLRHFDVAAASDPTPTTAIDTGVEGFQIVIGNGAAYLAHRQGVAVYGVSILGSKNLLNELTVPGVVDGLVLDGNTLYVEGSGIYMLDVADPGYVSFVGNLGYVADRASNLTVLGECLYFDQYVSGDRGRINIAALHCTTDIPGPGNEVLIDIKPGSDENPINCRSLRGVIPVAILTTADFDALTVDQNTVRFGPGQASGAHTKGNNGRGRGHNGNSDVKRHEEDVDGDGDLDLVMHFTREAAQVACGDSEAILTGETFDGVSFTSYDDVRTVPGDSAGGGKNLLFGKPSLSLSPNPFNPVTTIAFNLPQTQRMRIEVYDLTGRRVAVVADDLFNAGPNEVMWRGMDNGGRSVASGVYFVRLSGSGVELKQRALLLK